MQPHNIQYDKQAQLYIQHAQGDSHHVCGNRSAPNACFESKIIYLFFDIIYTSAIAAPLSSSFIIRHLSTKRKSFIIIILKKMNFFLLVAALILLGTWYYNKEYLGMPEFFGSDWMASHYGVMLWNGWNYGSMPDHRVGPTPEYS